MHARRLFRLVVTPSALMYLLVGFGGGLLWLSVAARVPGLTASSPWGAGIVDAPRPLAVSSTGRVSLQEAEESVRRFTEAPGLALDGGLQTEGEESRRGELYYLESASPTPGDDFFKVDARTGEVIEATFRSRMVPSAGATDLTLADAETIAVQFARSRFWGFDRLVLVDRSVRTSDNGTSYTFRWNQLAQGSRAELPVSVSVSVMSGSREVFWYLGQRDQLQIDTRPAVERAQAVDTARAWLRPRDQRWELSQPDSVRLQVLYDDDDRQQLVWSVVFRARQDGPRSSIRLLIDAQNGRLIQGV
ncbi:MAG: hypothetical protein U0893_08715 [Chloroflexota bacterium]